jgi:predicted hydrocarbon binding protein
MPDGVQFDSLDTETAETPFFIMPSNALKSLRDELAISEGEKLTNEMLYRYGVRCGEGMIERMSIKATSNDEIVKLLPNLWAGVGLGRVSAGPYTDEEMTFNFQESIEARAVGKTNEASCHFTRGYLVGLVQQISDKGYKAVETACLSQGDEMCTIKLLPSTEYFEPAAEGQETAPTKDYIGESSVKLEKGVSYLLETEDLGKCYEIFLERTMGGAQGLCITRDFPDRVRSKYNIKKSPVIWLSNADLEYAVEPVQLGKLYHKIEDFLKKTENGLIILVGIEYLITQNNYSSALKFLQLIKDQISIYGATLLVPIVPEALAEKDLKLIEREFETVRVEK